MLCEIFQYIIEFDDHEILVRLLLGYYQASSQNIETQYDHMFSHIPTSNFLGGDHLESE